MDIVFNSRIDFIKLSIILFLCQAMHTKNIYSKILLFFCRQKSTNKEIKETALWYLTNWGRPCHPQLYAIQYKVNSLYN